MCLYFNGIDQKQNKLLSLSRPDWSPIQTHILFQKIWDGALNFESSPKFWRMLMLPRTHTLRSRAPAIILARLNCRHFGPLQSTSSRQDPRLHVLLPS